MANRDLKRAKPVSPYDLSAIHRLLEQVRVERERPIRVISFDRKNPYDLSEKRLRRR